MDLVEYYLRKIAGDDGGLDIDRIASGTTNKDRSAIKTVKTILSTHGGDTGLSLDELIQHGSNEGISESELESVLNKLQSKAEVIKTPSGKYKRV